MKKQYIQPSVQITNITLSSPVLVVSGGGGDPSIHSGIPTDEQW